MPSALSFLLIGGAADKALEWTQLSASDRSTIKSEYSAAGISLIVSAFGATDAPTTGGANAASTANTMAAWVKQYDLDGLDVDYEVCLPQRVHSRFRPNPGLLPQDFTAMDKSDGSAEAWLATFTQQIRTQLPQGQFILTHARKSSICFEVPTTDGICLDSGRPLVC